MSEPRIGELFSGYGGLGMGVQSVYGGSIAWHSDIDKGACKILAHRYPDVPNIGDITTVDWSQIEPVDILTGGSPCQDLSHAGKRQGMTEGTRSNLWVAMREAIAQLRPSLVVWENVRGAYSAAADNDLEPCSGCVGDRPGVSLRALGRVLGDLAELGFDARWHGLRAADVGAPHGRMRVFVVATYAASGRGGSSGAHDLESRSAAGSSGDCQRSAPSTDTRGETGLERTRLRPDESAWDGWGLAARGNRAVVDAADDVRASERPGPDGVRPLRSGDGSTSADAGCSRQLLPTPRATDGTKGGPNQRGSSGDLMLPSAVAGLLPTPTTRDHKGHNQRRDETCLTGALDGIRLLPTPVVTDSSDSARHTTTTGTMHPGTSLTDAIRSDTWGDYAAAIARWEHALGRPAPTPTMTSTKGNPQLAPRFVEFLMGLPAGWVTDVPGITRNEALKALGNGVVPQQATAALRVMASWEVAA